MSHEFNFISGLPRSGSTLLSALLLQNPRFHAGVTSAVLQLVATAQTVMSARNEFHALINDEMRENVLRGIFNSYYSDIRDGTVIFDSNRIWCSKLALLERLFPRYKVICCVRSPEWILDSFERLVQKNALQPTKIFNFDVQGNVYTRAEALNAPMGLLGSAYSSLKEAFYGAQRQRLIVVRYESLTSSPVQAVAAIYDALNEPLFAHNFENLSFDSEIYDRDLGLIGLHKVRPKLEFSARSSVLPPDLIARYIGREFWNDLSGVSHPVTVI